jgi:hypothetical protein
MGQLHDLMPLSLAWIPLKESPEQGLGLQGEKVGHGQLGLHDLGHCLLPVLALHIFKYGITIVTDIVSAGSLIWSTGKSIPVSYIRCYKNRTQFCMVFRIFFSGLWIRIRFRFSDFVDPDPYWESGSGSRDKKMKKFQWKNALYSYF